MALLALHVGFLFHISRSTTIKSVSLTPFNPTMNGATASCRYKDCENIHNVWNIDTNSIGFHLQIDLDHSWSFHPHKESIISFTLYSSTLLPSQLDPLVVFNVYIAHSHIYPSTCDASNHPSISSQHPSNTQPFPITITLINNPITHQSFTTLSYNDYTQICDIPSFDTNHALQLHIASHNITFTQIDINYEYNQSSDTTQPIHAIYSSETTIPVDIRWIDMMLANNPEDPQEIPLTFIIIVLTIIVIICCCCLCIICAIYKPRGREPTQRRASKSVEESEVIEIGGLESENLKKQKDMERAVVASWLENDVGLPQYFPLFIKHGYESLKFVGGIEEKLELKKIGIMILGHQTLIWAHIKQLKRQQLDTSPHTVNSINSPTSPYSTMAFNTTSVNMQNWNKVVSPVVVHAHVPSPPPQHAHYQQQQRQQPHPHQGVNKAVPRGYKQSDSDLWAELPPSFKNQGKRESDLWGEQQNDLPLSVHPKHDDGALRGVQKQKSSSLYGQMLGPEGHEDESKSFQSEQLYGAAHRQHMLYKKQSSMFVINIKKQSSADSGFPGFSTDGFIE